MRFWSTFLLFFPVIFIPAQTDSVPVTPERPDGIYLSYTDFRRNQFVSKDQIVSDKNKEQLDFVGKVLEQGKFSYNKGSTLINAESADVWGFYQNKTLYINFKNEFFRVPVFGSICYLVATVLVVNNGFYDPMFGYGVNANRAREVREFIINYYDGYVSEFTVEKAELLISRDAAIYSEYKNLSRRGRKEQLNRYIRKYNDAHPVYFLK